MCSKIFNSNCNYDDANLVVMSVPWANQAQQISSYGPSSILKASKTSKFLSKDICDFKHQVCSLSEEPRLRVWNSEACITKKDFKSELDDFVYSITKKIINSGKTIGVLAGEKIGAIGAIRATSEKYANMGLLSLDSRPYSTLGPLASLSSLKKIVVITSMKNFHRSNFDKVEVFSEKYLMWMESHNPWKTITYDIVSGLPTYNWLSLDASILKNLHHTKVLQILNSFVESGRIICGFDIWGTTPGKESLLIAEIAYNLCGLLLLSRGLAKKRPFDYIEELNNFPYQDLEK